MEEIKDLLKSTNEDDNKLGIILLKKKRECISQFIIQNLSEYKHGQCILGWNVIKYLDVKEKMVYSFEEKDIKESYWQRAFCLKTKWRGL